MRSRATPTRSGTQELVTPRMDSVRIAREPKASVHRHVQDLDENFALAKLLTGQFPFGFSWFERAMHRMLVPGREIVQRLLPMR
jgi:hypothetical protein